MTHFWNFGTSLIYPKRLKLETSNLAHTWMAVSTNKKNAKLCQQGSRGGHVTHFWNYGIPLISLERLKLETSNLPQRWMAVSANEKNAKSGKWAHVGVT